MESKQKYQKWQGAENEIVERGAKCAEALSAVTEQVNKELAEILGVLRTMPEFETVEFEPSKWYYRFLADYVARQESAPKHIEKSVLYDLLVGHNEEWEYNIQLFPFDELSIHVLKHDKDNHLMMLMIGEEVCWKQMRFAEPEKEGKEEEHGK